MRPERSSTVSIQRAEFALLIGEVERLTGADFSLQRERVSGAFTPCDFGALAADVLFVLQKNLGHSSSTEAQNRVSGYVAKNKLKCGATGL